MSSLTIKGLITRATATRWRRLTLVMFGLWALQFALFAPSLLGRRVLLPLELLGRSATYLPGDPGTRLGGPHDPTRADLVLQFEPERMFAARERAAGRWPRWLPYEYGGVPMRGSLLSPLFWLKCSTPSPLVLAWAQLLVATIAGVGFYAFARRVLRVGFWPAAVAGWCYSITGFFVLWQGYPVADTVCWFPWLLLGLEAIFTDRPWLAVAGVAGVVALILLGGQLDVAALVLLVGIAFAFARVIGRACIAGVRANVPSLGHITAGFALGFMLAAPQTLPFLEYARTGGRIIARTSGAHEERPPVGHTALPLVLAPDLQGTRQHGSLFVGEGNQLESAAGAYVGLVAVLLLAPVAWCSRRHRVVVMAALGAAILGLGWCANLPGWVSLLRLPGLNLLSFNRLVFLTGFSLLTLATLGLDALAGGALVRRWWFGLPLAGCALVVLATFHRAYHLPEPIATELSEIIAAQPMDWVRTAADVQAVQTAFTHTALMTSALALLAVVGWAVLLFRPQWSRGLSLALGAMMVTELFVFAVGRSSQADPALYYPPIGALDQAKAAGPGRVAGYSCLPANLAVTRGLNDVRGYDPIEPARMVELVLLGAHPDSPKLDYTALQWMIPAVASSSAASFRPVTLRVPPVLDLLGLRYLVFRGTPPSGIRADFSSEDYWIAINPAALPRAFVPRAVQMEARDEVRLQRMADPSFDPREVAWVETPVAVPPTCSGEATITHDDPTRVELSAIMRTPGLLVLADRWDAGWRAFVNHQEQPILRTNHALRGVVLPTGVSAVEFRYEPTTARWGSWAAYSALVVLGVLLICERRRDARS